jgi:hypothetical protein
MPLPCYETTANEYIKSSFEPVAQPLKPHGPVLETRPESK